MKERPERKFTCNTRPLPNGTLCRPD